MADGLRARVEKLRSRSEEEIDENDSTEQGSGEKKPEKRKPSERRGVGTPSSSSVEEARIKMLRAKLKAIKDPDIRKRLQDQIKALQEKK